MAQITHGLRSILSNPTVYSAFQNLMGAHQGRVTLVNEYIKPHTEMNILDVGCGPADILDYFPKVNYWGFDISPAYIDQANARFGKKGHFICRELSQNDLRSLPKFDVVLAIGVLHHLDNSVARNFIKLARTALKPDGRLITVDPCFVKGQNPLARFLVSKDRGQNVRTLEGYSLLQKNIFKESLVEVRHKKWIPYTHCFMECIR